MAVRVLRRPGRGEKARPEDYFDSIASVIVKNQQCATGGKTTATFYRFYTLDELKNLELDNYA